MSARFKTKRILVKRSYQFLAVLLIILSGGLLLLPEIQKHEGLSPEYYVKNMLSTERYISTDELADRIINEDPALLIIDTRTTEEFKKFSLPNAINIPVSEIFNPGNNLYLDQEVYDIVLYSNDHFFAEEVWMLGNRLGYQRLYVLQGGLNAWFNTIIKPIYPDQTMSNEEFERYNFRKAAGKYFGVATDTIEIITEVKIAPTPKKKVVPKPKKKKRMPEGGC